MDNGGLGNRVAVHDLLEECAKGSRTPEQIGDAILQFSKSDSAPDAHVLSDLLLDTLFLYDSGVSVEDVGTMAAQRERLGRLIPRLIEGQCVNETDAYERLEPPLLFAAQLIPDAKAFEKKSIRINTNLLYRQQKFNLLREENEGYAKFLVEFEAFLSTTQNLEMEDKALQLLNNIQSLIGYFDLDPNRVLDILVELAAANLVTHWRFLIVLFRLSPWFVSDQHHSPPEEKSMPPSDLSERPGNKSAAQIIGFKFQQLRQSLDDDLGLVMLSALLIKEGLIRLQDLWPHLAPDDKDLSKEKTSYQNRMLDEVDKAKGRNALAMSGGLEEEPSSSGDTVMKDGTKQGDVELEITDKKQKISLLSALLSVGALPESLFVLSESSFLLSADSNIADSFNILLEMIIEPLWTDLRPQRSYTNDTLSTLLQPKRVPEELKYRDSALILPPPQKFIDSLKPTLQQNDSSIRQKFFYDDVGTRLKLCTSYKDFDDLVLPYLRLAGIQVHRSITLCTKLARIGKAAIAAFNGDADIRLMWKSVLRSNLLPALSLIDANSALVNDIHGLVKEFETEERFSLYGEWFVDSYRRIPELKVQFIKTEKETKSLLRRISKTNTKEYGRRLAKVSHSNPCIVLNIALNQIESYDNLVDVVIEASRYFTLLSFDVLVYVMLTLLSNTQKRRLKEDGTSVAHWLQSLSSFTAKIFKRYSHMDPSPICIYVAKQLKLNNAFDLIILRDLINEMAGIRPNSDLSEEQLQGCSGGPFLRVEALSLINERRDPAAKAPLRLVNALTKMNLLHSFPILMGQQRSQCVFNVPEEQSLLKLLANLADEVSQILLQYLEFATLNTDMSTYSVSIPSISSMVLEKSLEPVVAFMVARPAIQAALHHHNLELLDQSKAEKLVDPEGDEQMTDGVVEESQEEKGSTGAQHHTTSLDRTSIINGVSESVKSILPEGSWRFLTTELYATFWSLSLYDISVPTQRYQKEIQTLQQQTAASDGEKSDVTANNSKPRNGEKTRLQAVLEGLQSELTAQEQNLRQVRELFESRKIVWFDRQNMTPSDVLLSDWRIRSVHTFVQHCLLPRCFVSPNDATYCAQFLQMLHKSATPNFDMVAAYLHLFGPHLTTTIFSSTEREAENLGRFLADVLGSLNDLSQDEAAYSSSKLLEFSPTAVDDPDDHEYMSWAAFNNIWYSSIHRSIWSSIKACFESKEYMHIRNVLIVLDRLQAAFPYFKWIGKNVEKEVDLIISSERREDLKIRALGCKAVLKKRQPRWKEVPGKSDTVSSSTASDQVPTVDVEMSSETKDAVSVPIVELTQDKSQGSTAEPNTIQQNEQGSANDNASASSPQTTETQRDLARRKAASLSKEIRAKQEQMKSGLGTSSGGRPTTPASPITVTATPLSDVKKPQEIGRKSSPATNSDRGRGDISRRDDKGRLKAASSRPSTPESDKIRSSHITTKAHDFDPSRDGARHNAQQYRDNSSPRLSSTTSAGAPYDHRSRVSTEVIRGPQHVDKRGASSFGRSMPPPHAAVENNTGRLNDAHYKPEHSDKRADSRSQIVPSPTGRSTRELRDSSGGEKDRNAEWQPQSQDRPYARPPRNDRDTDNSSPRSTPGGPKSLASRINTRGPPDQKNALRNAPDGPRQSAVPSTQPSRGASSLAPQLASTPEHFVHPSRLAPTEESSALKSTGTSSSRDRREAVDSRYPQQHTKTSHNSAEPTLHPSRQVPARATATAERLENDRARSSRSTYENEPNTSSSSYSAPDSRRVTSRSRDDAHDKSELSRGSSRDVRDNRARESASEIENARSSRPTPGRDIRNGSRMDTRPIEKVDGRQGRIDRGSDRVDSRRDRASEKDPAIGNEVDYKRRHASDSREAGRPAKQRRQA